MIRRIGKFGKYLACSNYPECQNIVSEIEQEISAVKCPKCGENMVVKSGKFGKFLACPSYPDCKTTLPMPSDEQPKMAGKCPECGAAMSERKSKRGKTYYSCIGYPDCKFMSWDIPTGDKCAECGSAMVQVGRGVKCSNKDCKGNKTQKKSFQMSENFDFMPDADDPPIYDDYYGQED